MCAIEGIVPQDRMDKTSSTVARPIHFEVLATCEHATVDRDQKLVMVGVFDTLWVKELPAMRPFIYVVSRYRVWDQGNLKFTVERDDGTVLVAGKDHPHSLPKSSDPDGYLGQGVWNIGGLVFQQTGRYLVRAYFNGTRVAELPLFVKQQETGD